MTLLKNALKFSWPSLIAVSHALTRRWKNNMKLFAGSTKNPADAGLFFTKKTPVGIGVSLVYLGRPYQLLSKDTSIISHVSVENKKLFIWFSFS